MMVVSWLLVDVVDGVAGVVRVGCVCAMLCVGMMMMLCVYLSLTLLVFT